MVNVAILGAGRIGNVHAAAVAAHPEGNIKYVVDVFKEAADKLAAAYGAVSTDMDTVFNDGDVDVIMICTITETHADLIERGARSGKAIFCEKPIALDMKRVDEALAVVKKEKAKLMLGFNRRFDPNFLAVKDALDAGEIGVPEIVTITSRDPGPPPAEYIKGSGGLFRDMTIHDFDIARWLLDEEPETVYASASAIIGAGIGDLGDVDTAVVTLTCKSGRMAVITNSRRATYGYDQRIEVHGSGGMLQAKNVLESTKVKATGDGVVSEKPLHFFLERYSQAYRAEFAALVENLKSGKDLDPTGDDGRRALALADAALESLKKGAPVRVG